MMQDDGIQLWCDVEMLQDLEDNQTMILGTAFSIRQK